MPFLYSIEIDSYAMDKLFPQDNLLFLCSTTHHCAYTNPERRKMFPRVTRDKSVYF